MMYSGITLASLPHLGLSLRSSPLANRFLTQHIVAFKAFMMSEVVLPVQI
uniref:Uncharacterized protein n=1 Tax=Lepeophtheirus salmonis TaxID=72036 RepID=A0A0K2V0D5_LEPSM